MKLYRTKVSSIAHAVVEKLCQLEMIEVSKEFRSEAEQDLVAIMEEYLRRDTALNKQVKDHMHDHKLSYDLYGKVRRQVSEEWGHPFGYEVEKFLSRQFLEDFMLSKYVEEVFVDDDPLLKTIMNILKDFDVNEEELKAEAESKILNIKKGTVDYEIALAQALRDVKKRRGLLTKHE